MAARLRAARWGAGGAAVLALGAAVLTLRLWNADLAVPFRYSAADDTKFYLGLVKGIIDHGWALTNSSLGAPLHQQLYDFPQGADNLNWLLIKALAVLWPHAGTVVNLFFLLSFPLTAVAAYLVMRQLGVSRAVAVVCGTVFALLPYHFFRSDSHLMLSAYYSVPLGAYLFVRIVQGEPLLSSGRWFSARTGWTVLSCVLIASTGLYYAVFAFVLVLAGTVLALAARHSRAVVLSGAAVAVLIAAVLAVNLSPTIVYRLRHGANSRVTRSAAEGDDLGLSISYLVLPPLADRIAPLRHVTEQYRSSTPPAGYCEQCFESVGTVGTVGFGWLAIVGIAALLGAPWALKRPGVERAAAAGVAVCIAVGATGGASSLVREYVSNDIRAWNRMSLQIAFFSLLAVGLLLDAARRRLRAPGFAALLGAIVALTVYEQSAASNAPPYARDASEYSSDQRFVAAIERALPAGASVLQLPYVPYPEGYQPYMSPDQTSPFSPQVNFEYELMRGYLQSRELRWSYGAMKGRASDWESRLASLPVSLAVTGAAAAGFDGVYVDLRGYPGGLGPRLQRALGRLLRVAPLGSGYLLFYDLRPYRGRLSSIHSPGQLAALRDAVLHPRGGACAAASPAFRPFPAAGPRTGVIGPPCRG
jgi:phosphoglycerol transferase